MRVASRFTLWAMTCGGILGIACGDSNAPPAPETLTIASGDGQFAFFGTALPAPLTVRVNGPSSQPAVGVAVTWTVTTGMATLGASSSQTDASGLASTTVTVGDQPGPLAVRATVTGLTPVTFAASACALPTAFTLGDTISAALATTDCKVGGFYTDFFTLDLTSGGQQGVTISMTTTAFDPWVDLYHGDGAPAAFNDDSVSGVFQNSFLEAIVAPGTYVLAPNSFDPDTTGAYDLGVVTRAQALADCDVVWLTAGVTVTDSVTPADCADSGPYYYDFAVIFADSGSVLTMVERSTAFNAAVFLYNASGNFVASNDDSAAGVTTDAYLAYSVPQTAPYLLVIATSDTGETGAYTFAVTAPTTLSRVALAGARPPLRAVPRRAPKGAVWTAPLPRAHRCC